MVIPPLRERREDIPLLIQHFLKKYNQEEGQRVTGFSPEALEPLGRYPWPGNIRELENLVERLVVLKGSGVIEPADLPASFRSERPHDLFQEVSLPEEGVSFRDLVQRFETELIRKALAQSGGNKNQAARLLQLNRTTLIEKMKRISADSED